MVSPDHTSPKPPSPVQYKANPQGKIHVSLIDQRWDGANDCTASRLYSVGPKLRVDSNLYIGETVLCLSVHLAGSLYNEEYRWHSTAHLAVRRQGSEIYALLVRSGWDLGRTETACRKVFYFTVSSITGVNRNPGSRTKQCILWKPLSR